MEPWKKYEYFVACAIVFATVAGALLLMLMIYALASLTGVTCCPRP